MSIALHREDADETPNGGRATPVLVQADLTHERPIQLYVSKWPKDGRLHAHLHLALEIGVLLSGRAKQNHGEGWFDLLAGQVWACGALEAHWWRVVHPTLELRFVFLPSLFADMPRMAGLDPAAIFRSPIRSSAIGLRPAFQRKMARFGRELAQSHRAGTLPGRIYVDLLRFIEMVGREVTPQARSATSTRQPWTDLAAVSRMQAALEMIEQRPERRIAVTDAARACHMSRSNFDRGFHQLTGFGFAEYALRSRLARAAHALRSGGLPVKAVAARFGFRDASHFHHTFTAHYGMTPGQYRTAAY